MVMAFSVELVGTIGLALAGSWVLLAASIPHGSVGPLHLRLLVHSVARDEDVTPEAHFSRLREVCRPRAPVLGDAFIAGVIRDLGPTMR